MPSPDAALTGPSHNLKKVAVAVAAGAIIGTRSRLGGALVLAGLAWMAVRHRRTENAQNDAVSLPASAGSLEDILAPTNPFIEQAAEEVRMEELRAALIPPPSLFVPPMPMPAAPPPLTGILPESALLQSAPVYVEVDETVTVPGPEAGSGKDILPDTISIPTTPDPPPGLLADSLPYPPSKPLPTALGNGAASVVPKAGIRPPAPPAGPTEAPAPEPRKGFLDWLRE